jgi:phosphatidylserine decarboxylase
LHHLPREIAIRSVLAKVLQQEDINFLLTNRIPRRLLTRLMARFSRIEQPLVRDLSIAMWRLFADLELDDAAEVRFASLHDCFIRRLRPDARPLNQDPAVVVSPCDAIVGAFGQIADGQLLQAKGFPYSLRDLLGDAELVERYRDSRFVTLRLTSSMYHRFHAPHDLEVERVIYISGDTWNTNPIALRRIERLFCKNERAVLQTTLQHSGHRVALVAVASVLIASIRLHFLDVLLHLDYAGPNVIPCSAAFRKGEEMGWFQHGSTIIVFAPAALTFCQGVREGSIIRMGEPLLELP